MIRRFFLACGVCAAALAQYSPEETVAKLSVAEGLQVTLFAAEPDLWNPTTIDVDAEGRIWVCEARNYRLFNQPITDKAGDRIRVLVDTDGDGRCDKATTFYQDPALQAPMGIAVLGDRVYVCQAPDLFYLEDANRDGVADKRTVVLTGFQKIDNDHAIHGVTWGPDGLLYFSNGDQGLDVTDKSGNRIRVGKDAPYRAATVLRCDLDGIKLELLAEGMRNPYEPAVDPFGNVFISDNDDDGNEQCRVNYIVDGANYGYWPRRKGNRRLDEVHWNTDQPGVMPTMVKTGFGSPTGMLYYQGTLLPERYHGTVIHADAGPRVIRSYRPTPNGAGYSATIDTLVSCDSDTWFRPSDVCAAPDGALYIADWYDPGVGGHRMRDVARGRIYRLAPTGSPPSIPSLDVTTVDGIVAALHSPNQARRFLGFAAAAAAKVGESNGPAWTDLRTALEQSASLSSAHAARVFWILADTSTVESARISSQRSADLQISAIRRAARNGADALRATLTPEIIRSRDARVRAQALVSLRAFNAESWTKPLLLELAAQYDGADRFYREAVGIAFKGREAWAYNELIASLGGAWDARLAGLVTQLHPPDALPLAVTALHDAKMEVALRLEALNAIDVIGGKAAGAELVRVLEQDAPAELKAHALHLLARDEGDVWRGLIDQQGLNRYLEAALQDNALHNAALAFIAETRYTPMLPRMVASAADAESAQARTAALEVIQALATHAARSDANEVIPRLQTLLDDPDNTIRSAAMKAIGSFRGDKALDILATVLTDANASLELRRDALRTLGASKAGATALIALAEKQQLPNEFVLDATEMLHASPHENVRLMAEKALPRATTREGQSLPPLTDMLAMQGDSARGREVFFSPDRAQCYRCHVVNGEGKNVGPDLSKIGQKASKENLFESILNPSAAIAPEYKVWILSTLEEGALSGFIRSESADTVELMDSAGTSYHISTKDILEKSPSQASLMPNGLTAALTAQELCDLVAFLQELK